MEFRARGQALAEHLKRCFTRDARLVYRRAVFASWASPAYFFTAVKKGSADAGGFTFPFKMSANGTISW